MAYLNNTGVETLTADIKSYADNTYVAKSSSIVSSVNNKNGTVVLDADDVGAMAEWDLLWENASPTSTFGTVDVGLTLVNYDAVYIIYRHSTSNTDLYSNIVIKGTGTNVFQILTPNSNNTAWLGRPITVTDTKVAFEICELRTQGTTGTTSTRDTYIIPILIYGIKGVQTS